MQLSKKVFILQIDKGRFQAKKSYTLNRKLAFICQYS